MANTCFTTYICIGEARAKIEEIIGRKLNDEEDLNDALDEWADENEIEYVGYHVFKVVDD